MNSSKYEQGVMKDLVRNVIHDNKRFDNIVLFEFVISQCSNNTLKCEEGFM